MYGVLPRLEEKLELLETSGEIDALLTESVGPNEIAAV